MQPKEDRAYIPYIHRQHIANIIPMLPGPPHLQLSPSSPPPTTATTIVVVVVVVVVVVATAAAAAAAAAATATSLSPICMEIHQWLFMCCSPLMLDVGLLGKYNSREHHAARIDERPSG